jgi:hypothetical protein
MKRETLPRGVALTAGFFVLSGILELALSVMEVHPLRFWPIWEALGRGLAHLLLAAGLLGQRSVCRSLAMIYCLAAVITYGIVLGLALAHAPVRIPNSVVLLSIVQVPACALLLPYLRSSEARLFFTKPLFGR